jgi:parallel beta-helix repeat protein
MNPMNKFFLLVGILFMIITRSYPTSFPVTTVSDAGVGSLRQAIINANADLTSTAIAPHTITFSGAGIGQINLLSVLPAITNHVNINGGTLGTVIVDAGNSAIPQHFLLNAANCSGSIIQNMVLNNGGTGAGVYIVSPAVQVTVTNCRIGTNAAGSAAIRQILGIQIDGAADGNHTISNNLLSGTVSDALQINNSTSNTIINNYIGLDATGSTVIPVGNGMNIKTSDHNLINKNVASGSNGAGILLTRSTYNTITGNYVGTDKTGLVAIGNAWDGIGLLDGSNYNMIGGVTTAARNICCGGNSAIASGIAIKSDAGLTSSYNTVINNYCGVGSDGTTALGNVNFGIYLGYNTASNNIIGKPGFGNVIANNGNGAVYMENAGTINNSVRGNSIYCNGPGTAPGAGQANVGIKLNGANTAVATPVINNSSSSSNVFGSGLAPGDTVDLYYIDGCRGCTYPNGKTYIATVFADASGNWSYTGGVTTSSTVTVTVTKYNGSALPGNTSEFSACSMPLPVTLISFTAAKTDQGVLLSWATTTEKNNAYFVIERSTDGIHFEPIGKVEGNGNSNTYLSYSFTDYEALQGKSYYRLKQVDFNASVEYSTVVSVENNPSSSVYVYPSPISTGSDIQVRINGIGEEEEISIEVIDTPGKLVMSYLGKGTSHSLSSSNLAKGFYTVVVRASASNLVTKFIVQ